MTTTNLADRRLTAKTDAAPAYQARRDEIIAAAGRVFLAKGYRAASFRDIAEAVGLDRASLYYYFESKQDLFRTVTGAAVVRNTEEAERIATSDATPEAKIAEVFSKLLDSYTHADYPYMYIFLQEDVNHLSDDPADPWARKMNSLSRRYNRAVTRIIQEGIDRGEFVVAGPASVLTKAIIGMANWTHRWYRPGGSLSTDEIAHTFTQTFLRGVAR
ncbi:MAG TPA: TetR/AcrR family transcriptional regulator [Acidimicrobiia bacterium]|nr:TetR/AcrR family transcriptional regulator [Acidimicrobiia bacterium]